MTLVFALYAETVAPEEKCIIPECMRKRYSDGSVVHHYCSKSHADAGRQRGIFRKQELAACCAVSSGLSTFLPFLSLFLHLYVFVCSECPGPQGPV